MLTLRELEIIKSSSVQRLRHVDALPTTTHLNDDRYEILFLEEVCERAFVYKAYDQVEDRFVSIKEFYPRDALGIQEELYFVRNLETLRVELKESNTFKIKQYELMLEGFIEEATYMEKISYGDPVLRIIDSFKDFNTAYIVTNYNQWPSLYEIIESGHDFTGDELDWISTSIIDILMRFHKRMIVHRNINPKTIYIKPGELILDSIGACDFLQDIKIIDADQYRSNYLGPEVMMHDGEIGTWTDIYAFGKVLIDIVSTMANNEDYFDGLETLDEKQGKTYQSLIQSCIMFDYSKRIQNATVVKKQLMYDLDIDRSFKTPKSMIAAIAMISFISCMMLVLTYNNDTMVANEYIIIEEEEVPLGSVTIEQEVCYFVLTNIQVQQGSDLILRWFVSGAADVSHMIIRDNFSNELTIDLEKDQNEVELTAYALNKGWYTVDLYYEIDDEIRVTTMELKILE